ncbi:unnamed protein product [Mytilus coruscus]|uniref:Uncharacterized protein n=1 Tax=Mytilus coruscus TaxID=42192 RepID=A0A6J8BZB2_MYTCO|nr:unnamed protein product [Mytilus coruscus]
MQSTQKYYNAYRPQQTAAIQIQKQQQVERLRSIEASKQMVFEVYGNTIGILEEFERRESKNKSIKRSQVQIPDQSGKDDNDVQTILQAQILILQTQMKTCDTRIRKEVSDDLRDKTLRWVASREKQRIADGETDIFVGQVFEVISNKEAQHPKKFYRSPASIENVTMNDMATAVSQQARIGVLDTEYVDHQKKAKIPNIRKDDIILGIERFRRNNKHLIDILPHKPLKSHWGNVTDEDLNGSIGEKRPNRPIASTHTPNRVKTKGEKRPVSTV